MAKALNLKWSDGNGKLKKTGTVSFNLPAFRSADGFEVCPMASVCASLCYARQGRYIMPDTIKAREFNLAIVRGDLDAFVTAALADLKRIRKTSIRVHDSGDFFSQAYLDAWFRIAAAFPEKNFYAYTKSLHLNWTAMPANFQCVQSVGGKLDSHIDPSKSHSRIFPTHEDRIAAGYYDGNESDAPAQRGEQRIGLVYHGTFKLKRGQAIALRQIGV